MVLLKLEKLGVLENGVLFIAAVIIMIIILFLLLFFIFFITSRSLYDLALARPSEFSFLDSLLVHLAVATPVFSLSSNTPGSFLPQDLCFGCSLLECPSTLSVYVAVSSCAFKALHRGTFSMNLSLTVRSEGVHEVPHDPVPFCPTVLLCFLGGTCHC